MKTAELKPILIDFLSWWQRNTQDASEPNEDWMDETTVDSYLSTYKNQSQPIEKEQELKAEPQRVYKLVDHWHKKSEELEAQLRELLHCCVDITGLPQRPTAKQLRKAQKALESSPTEQPE